MGFSSHLKDRIRRARLAFWSVPSPQLLSLRTAEALFDLKLAPIATYGIRLIWPYLKDRHLEYLDQLKAAFLKKVLGVHRTARNRLVYLVSGSSLFTEDIVRKFSLERTEEYERHVSKWEDKMADVDPGVFTTPVMRDHQWKEPQYRTRHRLTRAAMHGFHYQFCEKQGCREPGEWCRCRRCGEKCSVYHMYSCCREREVDWANV